MTKLIIARHGNTFTPDETPRRVGAKTDPPLTEQEKGTKIGEYLATNNLIPDNVFSGPLLRHTQTAELALKAAGVQRDIVVNNNFNEIDYGIDENKTEDEVIDRLGQQAIDDWNNELKVPNGWRVDIDSIISEWKSFANNLPANSTNLLVSSNGIIRFAPHIMQNPHKIMSSQNMKVPTGAICVFEKNDDGWLCLNWALRP